MGNLIEWHCQVDSSGRVSLPPQCRQWYANGLVLRYWPQEGCVTGWPVDEWLDAEADQTAADIESIIGRKCGCPKQAVLGCQTENHYPQGDEEAG